ncbi:MAG: hypothetical protein RLZ98_1678 [Pseudomonadota bacterium]
MNSDALDFLLQKKWTRAALILAFLSGATLTVIGLRFLFQPDGAATFFGIARDRTDYSLHYVVAFRDLWLGLLAIALALFRDWRGLALWLVFGSFVCFADAWVAATSSGRWVSTTFHLASGVFCAALGSLCWLHTRQETANNSGA